MIDQTVVAAAVVGAVNFGVLLYPPLNSRGKMLLAIAVAVALQYVQFDVNPLLKGLEIALASSGVYKIGQLIGSKA